MIPVRAAQAAEVGTARDTSSSGGASRRCETTPRVLRFCPVRAGGRRGSAATDASKAQVGDEEDAVEVETGGCKPEGGDGRRCSSRRLPGSSWGDGRLCRDDTFGGGRAPGRRKPRRGYGLFGCITACERVRIPGTLSLEGRLASRATTVRLRPPPKRCRRAANAVEVTGSARNADGPGGANP